MDRMPDLYRCHRFPGEIISHAVRSYHSQAAPGPQAGVVLGPVGDPVPLLGDVPTAIGIALERHGGAP
jgi:hypothetical protein